MLVSLVLGSVACQGVEYTPYYDNPDAAPTVDSMKSGDESELGNIGGNLVVINGSGFGDDPSAVVVYFDSLNAEVVEVSDDKLRVLTPQGPIQGGVVDIRVATPGGLATAQDFYTYEVADLYDNEVGYISTENYWRSCYGGGEDVETATGGSVGCEGISYIGQTGLAGKGEFFDFAFPRVHTESYGFLNGATDDPGEGAGWKIEIPGMLNTAAAVEDLRQSIGDFHLTNDVWEDKVWCADLDGLGQWIYGGGDGQSQKVIGGGVNLITGRTYDADETCGGETRVDMSVLQYCEVPEYGGAQSNEYEPFWPVGKSFFAGAKGALGHTRSVEIGLIAEGAGIDVDLALPEPLVVEVHEGVPAVADTPSLWSLSGEFDACFDDDGGTTSLRDVAVRFQWKPSEQALTDEDGVSGRTMVRFSLTALSLGWMSIDGYPARALIAVPDRHNVFERENEEGELEEWSEVEVPASVIYQLPTTNSQFYTEPGGGGLGGGATQYAFGDPLQVGYGYLMVSGARVTEYAIPSEPLGGDVIYNYVTGDFGFFSWEHPLEKGGCGDCIDGDGDGWADDADPDCASGGDRELGYAANCEINGVAYPCECHDGMDNDGDGDIDAEDADCESADDDQELTSPCINGVDDDLDGWIDDADPECEDGTGYETGFSEALSCNDGIDNDVDGFIDGEDSECDDADAEEFGAPCSNGLDDDSDGWFDSDDPDCGTPDDTDDGFGTTECNDGLDNDDHQDIDAEDPLCQDKGAAHDNEREATTKLSCRDEEDNDGDGFVDVGDPDCEFGNETSDSLDPLADSTPDCYDGVDNDGDALIDAEDLGCWNEVLCTLDGFLDDESREAPNCSCGVDDDGDGWIDGDDPDCQDPAVDSEIGLSATQCNDGLDNDGDTLIDSADAGCADATDDDESDQ